jgi:hypothetical protein
VHRHVGSRTSAQTRSHAQKYFNKLNKKNTKESIEELRILNRKEDLAEAKAGNSIENRQYNYQQRGDLQEGEM